MPNQDAIESADLFERVVLLTVAELTQEGKSPVVSYEVMERCRDRADDLSETSSGVERRKIMNALTRLTDAGLLTEERTDTSPTGKGRPEYTLETDVETLLEQLSADDRLSAYVDRIAEP